MSDNNILRHPADFEKKSDGYVIGFAGVFYTLWHVSFHFQEGFEPRWKAVFTYLKNISKDKDAATERYPGLTVDMGLSGSKSFERFIHEEEPETDSNIFPKGKYVGMRIDECEDMEYLSYLVESGYVWEAQKKAVIDCLIAHGYEVRISDDNYFILVMSPEMLERERQETEFSNNLRNTPGFRFEITFLSNIREDDNGNRLYYDPEHRLNLLFKTIPTQEDEYRGFYYYLPVIGGKGKRIKNKKYTITEYLISDRIDDIETVEVLNMEIVK